MPPDNSNENAIGIVLSIILAAATAHALAILSSSIPIGIWDDLMWTFFTFLAMGASILIIVLVTGFTNPDKIMGIKISLITFFSIFVFSLARFLSHSEGTASTYTQLLLVPSLLLGFCGLILVYWNRQKNEDEKLRHYCLIFGVSFIILAIAIICFAHIISKIIIGGGL